MPFSMPPRQQIRSSLRPLQSDRCPLMASPPTRRLLVAPANPSFFKRPTTTHFRCIQPSRLQDKARSRGLPKVNSIAYCCVATLVTGGKGYMNEYIGKDYYSHDPGPFKTLKQSIFEEDQGSRDVKDTRRVSCKFGTGNNDHTSNNK
jgi:hypothetical protein